MLSSFSLDSSVEGLGHLSASKQSFFNEAFPNLGSYRHHSLWNTELIVSMPVCNSTQPCVVLCEGAADHSGLMPTCCTMRAKASDMHSKDCVKVAVRVRPFNKVSQYKVIHFLFYAISLYLPDVLKYYNALYSYIHWCMCCHILYIHWWTLRVHTVCKREFLVMTKFVVKVSVKSI